MMEPSERSVAQALATALDVIESAGWQLTDAIEYPSGRRRFDLYEGTRLVATVAYREAEWTVVEPTGAQNG